MDCKINGCVRKVFATGLCHKHYEEERLANAPPCKIDGCAGKAERVGMCNKHYRQHKLAVAPPCSVDGCGRHAFVGGLCQTHHKRVQRYGSLDADRRAHDRGARRKHPLYESWRWHSRHGSLAPEWQDFWPMVTEVSERPSTQHLLKRFREDQPIGPGNWYWLETISAPDHSTYMRMYRQKNPAVFQDMRLRKNFGITLVQYNEMLDKQGGLCAVCRRPERAKGQHGTARELAVDHCHTTGKIRGLLCSDCNLTLGKVEDCVDRLSEMQKYLKRNK